jgi:hypothetical protein
MWLSASFRPPPVSLESLAASAGFTLKEKYTHAMSLGDVNADGADDLAFSNRVKISGSVRGSTYIVMGSPEPRVWPSPFSPMEATPWTVVGIGSESGASGPNPDHTDAGLDLTYPNVGTLAPLGDFNKDGAFDFAISNSLTETGTAYIVIGRRCAPCEASFGQWSGGDNRTKCWSEITIPFQQFPGNCVPPPPPPTPPPTPKPVPSTRTQVCHSLPPCPPPPPSEAPLLLPL